MRASRPDDNRRHYESESHATRLVEGRDPKRIDVVLGLLRAYWVKYPGLRLGQIIVNLTSNDPYNVEDTVLEQALRAALNRGKEPNGERPRRDRT